MADNAFNNTDLLRKRLSFLTDPDQWDLENILETANRRAKNKTCRTVRERLFPDHEDQRTFRLTFPEIIPISDSVDVRVRLYDEEVDSSNYSIPVITSGELLQGEITFDSSWAASNLSGRYRVAVEYIPAELKDLELAIAIVGVLKLSVFQTNDEEENNRLEQAKADVEALTNDINSSMPPIDRDRGKSLGANRRRHYGR